MKKALVTGGLGFIGSHLVDRLLKDEWQVVVLDNLLTGSPENLAHHKGNQKLQIIEGDIRDPETVKKVTRGCDVVFHMAAHALMRVSLKDHRADLDYNLIGTMNVLEAMIANNVHDFVFASTSAVYGEAAVIPTPEEYIGIQTSLYGASKLACVTAKASIQTEKGSKRISEIKVGDLVYTHKNNLRRVTRIFKRLYDGNLVKIRLGSSRGRPFTRFQGRPHPELPSNCVISATPEHPVLTEEGWKPIGQIRAGDKVSVVANRCIGCKKLIPFWTVSCSTQCMYEAFPDIKVKIGNASRGHRNYTEGLFSDPVRKAEWLKKTLQNKKINSHEYYISLLIKEAGGGETFKFTGNGQKVIGGFCPDFVSEELKAIIEYQGRSGARDARSNRDQERRIQTFRQNGYNVLILNTKDDFHHPQEAVQKIRSFIGESISIVVKTDPEFTFVPVRKIEAGKKASSHWRVNVYNLEVEEDNSYICQGIAMHNCEGYAEAYTEFSQLKFWGFRFGTVLGERCRRGAIWDFEHKLMKNPAELEILGNGKQSKDYLNVKDCVDGIVLGYEKSSNRVNIFNLGLQEQTTVDELADIVIEEMRLSKVKKKYTGGERGWIGDNPVVFLAIKKMKDLGWKPKMLPADTIRLTAKWTLEDISGRKIVA
ncbi:MAG: SDR family NAD(P)-dependent oxidoreductase [Nitrososphaerales archaeon]